MILSFTGSRPVVSKSKQINLSFDSNSIRILRMKFYLNSIRLIFLILVFNSLYGYADTKVPGQLTVSIGSVSTNFSESQSKIQSTDGNSAAATQPYSGTASSMPIDVNFEYFTSLRKSYFVAAGGPVMASTPDRFFYTEFGMNFYLSALGAPTYVSDQKVEIRLAPKFRYYIGPMLGVSYLVYNTKSAIKNDVIVDLGGQAGVIYSVNSKWGLRAEGNFSRGIGALLSSMTMKIIVGTSFNLNI